MTVAARPTSAVAFLALILPFGIATGYVSVTLGFLLTKAGLSTSAVAALVALSIWPQTWKVLWAPLVDTSLNAKTWWLIGGLATGLSILALSVIPAGPATVPLLSLLIIISSLASTLVSMASEILMAHGIEDERRGVVSGWSQAGNLGGVGLGGGLGLYLSQHVATPWVSGAALAVLCMACGGALVFVHAPDPPAVRPSYRESLPEVVRQVWSLARSRPGVLILVLMLLPIGSGGAQGLWSAVAGEWKAGADTVALVNGVMGGLASLVGALFGGWACDRMDRRSAYCLFGLALGVVAVAMAIAPRTPLVFIAATLAYAVILGACYAAYSAAVLEAIGKGAAATKFNLLASIANVPIAVMTNVDGALHDRLGSSGMLYGEAAFAAIAVAAFALLVAVTRPRRQAPA